MKRLQSLLQQSPQAGYARRRQRYCAVAGQLRRGVVVWGCGALGRVIAARLRDLDIAIAAFVDREPTLWGKEFCGACVLSPDAIRTGAHAENVVVIGVYTSAPLRALLSSWGRSYLTFPELAWGFPERFLPFCDLESPQIACENAPDVVAGLSVWSDDASRQEYLGQLEWRFTLDYDVLPPHLAASDTYFPPQYVSLGADEHFVDCGAFDGDSIREFLSRTGGRFGRITAFEADPENFRRLCSYVETLPADTARRINPVQMVVGERPGAAFFRSDGTVASSVGAGGVEVAVTTLDAIAQVHPISYVKMDIEGFEPSALAGGHRAIRANRPILAICLYHAFDHLWSIPNAIRALVPDYDLFLGRHSDECWELVCYAMPRSQKQPAMSGAA